MKKFNCNYLKLFRKLKTIWKYPKDVQNAYDEFQLLVKSEMENKLPTYESSPRDNRRETALQTILERTFIITVEESL